MSLTPSQIRLIDLEVFYRVGITEQERARPQRLLLTIEMTFDFEAAARTDRIEETIDYATLAQRLLQYAEGRSWNLIEKTASDLADLILLDFKPQAVAVEVKKFVIPQARYVSVSLTRSASQPQPG